MSTRLHLNKHQSTCTKCSYNKLHLRVVNIFPGKLKILSSTLNEAGTLRESLAKIRKHLVPFPSKPY